ncbi:protein O-GlcNAcase [Salinibacterium sp. G-O1]|uniref:protein O-GlcNAcase n=1 Tax=Salinibacterium sp. G-O1 TaxID=3046208 RepID=UPI0024B8AB87|nr:protein O-GlcNAcase [Salinibacterium sp. G-O1]MDJ0335253.1 protein O-GlcNAcase [Salinibacterium sp. G-O1]
MTSPFAVGGIIEGFYGTPWTHQQRLDMIGFIGRLGMNTYVYGPKDDAFLRRDWRKKFDRDALRRLRELVDACVQSGVTFTFALSPGLSMRYSSASDRDLLIAKYRQVSELGVSSFALLLDDIPASLQHPEDADVFASLVDAQITLIRQLHPLLDGELMVAPTTYWGRGDEPYLSQLGRGIDPTIDIFFTGRAICSPVLETVDAERFEAATGHPPLYWDNFPVNDVAMTHELHVGPYLGRDGSLGSASRGIIANAMPYPEASKIAFASIADYLADPEAYQPEQSWERAIELVAGADRETVRAFADALRGSALCTDDSPRLAERLERFAFDYSFGDSAVAVAELGDVAAELGVVASHMRTIFNRALAAEVEPWVDQYERAASAIALCAEIMGQGEILPAGRARVMAALTHLRSHRLRVHGDLVDMFLSDFAREFER